MTLLVMTAALAGCIQPEVVQETPVATLPGAVSNPTPATQQSAATVPTQGPNPPAAVAQVDLATVTQLIQLRGDSSTGLQVWYDQPLGSDRLQGFSYTNQDGLICAGFLLAAFPNGVRQPQNDNGAKGCAPQPGIGTFAGISVIVTSDGQPHTVIVGRVDDLAISAVAVVFNDGTNASFNPVNGGFLILRNGIAQVTTLTAINELGNTVIPAIEQVSVG